MVGQGGTRLLQGPPGVLLAGKAPGKEAPKHFPRLLLPRSTLRAKAQEEVFGLALEEVVEEVATKPKALRTAALRAMPVETFSCGLGPTF